MTRALLLLSLPLCAVAGPDLTVWSRAPGDHTLGLGRLAARTVDLGRLPPVETTRADIQYGAARTYLGVPLGSILATHPAPGDADTAVLHFANGMEVPVPLRPPDGNRQVVFVALAWKDGGQWSVAFPPVFKDGDESDRRPIRFGANKVVVGVAAHPMVGKVHAATYSPWLHADTLTGIEYVSLSAWQGQFDVAPRNPAAARGFAVFTQTCQMCHGVRGVGARFGWDLVEPMPAIERHPTAVDVLFHLRHRANPKERGLMMPALGSMSEADADALRVWLKALAGAPLRPYRP